MKVLTIKQPWASLIAHGIKDIENRTWKTNFRGRVLIHAGQALCRKSIFETLNFEQYSAFREKVGFSGLDFLEPKGAIIGSVEIVDCVINHPSVWAEKTKVITDHSDGVPTPCYDAITYNWVLANPVLFEEPIQGVKGKLSFWEYPIAKVVPLDELCSVCGYFTSQTDANNHYGCTHPEQSETDPCTEINGYYLIKQWYMWVLFSPIIILVRWIFQSAVLFYRIFRQHFNELFTYRVRYIQPRQDKMTFRTKLNFIKRLL